MFANGRICYEEALTNADGSTDEARHAQLAAKRIEECEHTISVVESTGGTVGELQEAE